MCYLYCICIGLTLRKKDSTSRIDHVSFLQLHVVSHPECVVIVVWMISGDIKFVVAHETECSRDHIFEAYAISTSNVVRLSSSRRLPLLMVIVSIEEKQSTLMV